MNSDSYSILLNNMDAEQRKQAIKQLARKKNANALKLLTEIALNDTDVEVRDMAAQAVRFVRRHLETTTLESSNPVETINRANNEYPADSGGVAVDLIIYALAVGLMTMIALIGLSRLVQDVLTTLPASSPSSPSFYSLQGSTSLLYAFAGLTLPVLLIISAASSAFSVLTTFLNNGVIHLLARAMQGEGSLTHLMRRTIPIYGFGVGMVTLGLAGLVWALVYSPGVTFLISLALGLTSLAVPVLLCRRINSVYGFGWAKAIGALVGSYIVVSLVSGVCSAALQLSLSSAFISRLFEY